MPNVAALKFLKQLIAAFSRFPVSPETKELYGQKLSRWKLTQAQWDAALDSLIEGNESQSLPSLNEIYGHLKKASYENPAKGHDMASVSFTLNGYNHIIRCRHDGAVWVIADLVWHDAQGQEHHLQAHVGEPVAKWIPEGAENILVSPDYPAMPQAEEMPSKAEVRELVSQAVLQMGEL